MSFDRTLALGLAEKIQAVSLGRLPATINIGGTDTQARVELHGDRAIVLFPGTASLRDLLTDLKAPKKKHGAGRVHMGFLEAFLSIAPRLSEAIENRRVYVAGHSLGGALAMLTADWLSPRVLGCYTFGQPRVFNGPGARDFNARLQPATYRIVNEGDPIPRIPWLFGTYRHAGTKVYLPREGEPDIAPSLISQGRALLREARAAEESLARTDTKGFLLRTDHPIAKYIERLKR